MKGIRLHYGWMVLAMAFLTLFAAQGVRSSFGAFVLPWQETFGSDRAAISAVASVSFFVYGVSQVLAGRLTDRFGARAVMSLSLLLMGTGLVLSRFATGPALLMITYGVLCALGFGGTSGVPAATAVSHWFPRHRGFAMSVIISGFAVGSLLISPLSLYLVRAWGWQSTLLTYGLVVALVLFPLVAAFLRSHPDETAPPAAMAAAADAAPAEAAPLTLVQLLQRREFWLLVLPFFVCGFTTLGFMFSHFVPLAQEAGIGAQTIATALAVSAAVEVVGTLLAGYLSDRWGRPLVLAMLYGWRAVAYGVLLLAGLNPVFAVVFALVFGLTDFATISPTGALCGDVFGRRSVGTVFGWVSFGHQLGAAVGALVPGVIYDLTGSYVPSVILCIVLLVMGIGVVLRTRRYIPALSGATLTARRAG